MVALDREDLDPLGQVILDGIESAHEAGWLYGGDAYEAIDPSGWAKSTFPAAAEKIAETLHASGFASGPTDSEPREDSAGVVVAEAEDQVVPRVPARESVPSLQKKALVLLIRKCGWHERTAAIGVLIYRNLPQPEGLCRVCFNRALDNPILRHYGHWVLEL